MRGAGSRIEMWVFEEVSGQNASFSASVSLRALELAPDQVPYVQTWTRIMRRRRISPGAQPAHEPETAIRKQTSLIEHGAVNLVTKHPQDSPHPRHGVQEALPAQR